jgi:hypothetical protein
MKTFAFAILIAVVAASPALAAKKSKRAAAPPPASASNNENSWRFARDSLPIFLPSWTLPAYMAMSNHNSGGNTKKAKR